MTAVGTPSAQDGWAYHGQYMDWLQQHLREESRLRKEYGPEGRRQVFSKDVVCGSPGERSVAYADVAGKCLWNGYIEPMMEAW